MPKALLSEAGRDYLPLSRSTGERPISTPLVTHTGSGRNLSIVTRRPYVSVPLLREPQSRQPKRFEVRFCEAGQLPFRQVEPAGRPSLLCPLSPHRFGSAPLRPPPGLDGDSRAAPPRDDMRQYSAGWRPYQPDAQARTSRRAVRNLRHPSLARRVGVPTTPRIGGLRREVSLIRPSCPWRRLTGRSNRPGRRCRPPAPGFASQSGTIGPSRSIKRQPNARRRPSALRAGTFA